MPSMLTVLSVAFIARCLLFSGLNNIPQVLAQPEAASRSFDKLEHVDATSLPVV